MVQKWENGTSVQFTNRYDKLKHKFSPQRASQKIISRKNIQMYQNPLMINSYNFK